MNKFYITYADGERNYHVAITAMNSMEAHSQWSAFEAGTTFANCRVTFISLSTTKTRGVEYAEGW